jgi:hypothetical protein
MSTPPRPEKMYSASLMTADAVPTRGLGASFASFVVWFGDSGNVRWLMLEYLDGEWRGRLTSIESNVVYLVVDRLPGFNFSTEDAHLVVNY